MSKRYCKMHSKDKKRRMLVLMDKYKGKCSQCGIPVVPHFVIPTWILKGHYLINPNKPEEYAVVATIDHIIPLCRGGVHALTNLTLLCIKCNNAKGDTITLPAGGSEGTASASAV
jgi:5-methylcytosine-specific restriction endonuclease McrA